MITGILIDVLSALLEYISVKSGIKKEREERLFLLDVLGKI